MKNLILIFILAVSFSIKSQTFIGKTKAEIVKLNAGNKLSNTEKIDTLLTNISFEDSKMPITHQFSFTKNNICVAYSIFTHDKATEEAIQKDIEKKSHEKLTDKSWVEKIDNKIYGWNLQGSEDFFVFTTTQIKQ